MTPAVSILLPVRNEEQHLPATLRSLQRQTLGDWELIAVDDGSQDQTPKILAAAAATDDRIRLFRQPPQGLVAALNFGLDKCRAAFVARIDGDDIAHPQRLALQLAALQQDPTLTLVASRVRHFPRPQLQGGMHAYERWQNSHLQHADIMRDLYVESPFAHPSVMYRRQVILACGGYRDAGWAEDYDLWLRLALQGERFERLPQTLLYWRDRPERLTRTAENCTLEAFRACKAHYLRQDVLAATKQVTLWGAGQEGKAWRKALQKQQIEVGCWIDIDRNKIGQTIHHARVLSPDQYRAKDKILVTVGAKGARQLIRDWCRENRLLEGQDFLCVT